MVASDALIAPFESWNEGLLNLADSLDSVDRTEIMVSRLEATAQNTKITFRDICALALLTSSSARFDPSTLPKVDPHPTAVALAEKLNKNGEFDRLIAGMVESTQRERDLREQAINLAFPEADTIAAAARRARGPSD